MRRAMNRCVRACVCARLFHGGQWSRLVVLLGKDTAAAAWRRSRVCSMRVASRSSLLLLLCAASTCATSRSSPIAGRARCVFECGMCCVCVCVSTGWLFAPAVRCCECWRSATTEANRSVGQSCTSPPSSRLCDAIAAVVVGGVAVAGCAASRRSRSRSRARVCKAVVWVCSLARACVRVSVFVCGWCAACARVKSKRAQRARSSSSACLLDTEQCLEERLGRAWLWWRSPACLL